MTWTPRAVADALVAAVSQASMSSVLIGTAAFIAGIIYKGYPAPVRKQQVVNFANAVLDMVERVEASEAKPEGEAEGHEDSQEAWMKWSQ